MTAAIAKAFAAEAVELASMAVKETGFGNMEDKVTKNLFASFQKTKVQPVVRIDRATYDKAAAEINNRVDTVTSGLYQIGIRSVRLNTKQLAELYYDFNNPDTAVREPLVDFTQLATTYVKKGTPNA